MAIVTPEAVQRAIAPDTSLVCVGYANNELGTVQPLRDIAAVVERERQQRLAGRQSSSHFPDTATPRKR